MSKSKLVIKKIAEDLRRGERVGASGDGGDKRLIVKAKTNKKINIKLDIRQRVTSGMKRD